MAKQPDITKLAPVDAARLLKETGICGMNAAGIKRLIKEGAPSKRGRVNFVEFVAWLLKEKIDAES